MVVDSIAGLTPALSVAAEAVVRAFGTHSRRPVFQKPRLTLALAGAPQTEIVALNAGRADGAVEAEGANRRTGGANSGLVVEVPRLGNASAGRVEQAAKVTPTVAGQTLACLVASQTVVGTLHAFLSAALSEVPRRTL